MSRPNIRVLNTYIVQVNFQCFIPKFKPDTMSEELEEYIPEDRLCPKCHENEKQEQHECPHAVELNNDEEFRCECCDKCAYECYRDV